MTFPRTVRYLARDVPCLPGALDPAEDALRAWAAAPGGQEMGEPGEARTADVLHRHLIAASKKAYGYHRGELRDALMYLRPHSALYTPRTCGCLRAAARTFLRHLSVALGSLGASGNDVWDATEPDGRHWAHAGALTPATVLRARADWIEGAVLRKHGKTPIEAHIEGPDTVRVVTGRNHQVTFRRLPADRAPFASAMFPAAVAHHPSSVSRWPPALVLLAAHLRSTSRGLTGAAMFAGDLLAAGFADLDQVGQEAALALVTSGLGVTDPLELIANAAAISSPVA